MATLADCNLPPTYKGLQLSSPTEPLSIVSLPTPLPAAGTVILKPLYSNVVSFAREVFANGNPRGYPYALPMVPSGTTVARVVAVPPDATVIRPGKLALVDMTVRARDDPDTRFLLGLHQGWNAASAELMAGEWRNGGWAELVKAPIENVFLLDEDALVGRLGYAMDDLALWSPLLVPFGGLSDVGVRVGETVLIAPATGSFGGGAVRVALALGARVIAMGRNEAALEKLKDLAEPGRVETVKISGSVETDFAALQKFGPIDVYFDISPPGAAESSHIKAGILAIKPRGRVSIMGGVQDDVKFPYPLIMFKNLTLKGTFMYTPDQTKELIRLVESGILKTGTKAGWAIKTFPLEEWKDALETSGNEANSGLNVFFTPNSD